MLYWRCQDVKAETKYSLRKIICKRQPEIFNLNDKTMYRTEIIEKEM